MTFPRRGQLAVVLVTFGAGCARPAPRPAAAEAALRTTIATYDSAWLAKDGPAVARLLAPGYTYFTSTGGLNDRAGTLAFLADTSYVLTLSRRSEVRVTMAGPVAGVSSRWEGAGRFRGEVVRDDQTCGQTWLREEEHWLLLTEHCVNRPASDPAAS